MKVFFLLFQFLLILPGAGKLFAQTVTDSTVQTQDSDADEEPGDSIETMVINPYSLYRIKARNGFDAADTLRSVNKNQIKSFLLNPDYAYANDPAYWSEPSSAKSDSFWKVLGSPFLKWFILSGMIVLVLFGIYRLAMENSFNWFTRKTRGSFTDAKTEFAEVETDYDAAILRYQTQGDFRLAIRFLYLRLLNTVALNTRIPIRESSTNAEITVAFANHPLTAEFRSLSRAYEYIFYGGYNPDIELYESLKHKFEEFQKFTAG